MLNEMFGFGVVSLSMPGQGGGRRTLTLRHQKAFSPCTLCRSVAAVLSPLK